MADIKRDNHYVPQMYLQQWATNGHIFQHRLLVPDERMHDWSSPGLSHVAVQRNLYVRMSNNQEMDDFEIDFNTRIETPAVKPLRSLCAGDKITSEEWIYINDFIMAQYLRTPAYYLKTHEKDIKMTEEVLETIKLENKPKNINTRKRNERANTLLPIKMKISRKVPDNEHAIIEYKAIVGKNAWLMSIDNCLNDYSQVKQFFRKLKWTPIICHPKYQWPTSDNPFVIINPKGFIDRQDGLANSQNLFLFPISPSIVLISKPKGRFSWKINATEEETRGIICRIVNNAYLYVYAKQEDNYICSVRPRKVDLKLFLKIKSMFQSWYENYQDTEGPYLTDEHGVIQ